MRTTLEANMDLTEAQKDHLNQLNEVDEKRAAVVDHTLVIKQTIHHTLVIDHTSRKICSVKETEPYYITHGSSGILRGICAPDG